MIRRSRSQLTFWLVILTLSNAQSLVAQSTSLFGTRGEVPRNESDAEEQSPEFTTRNYYVASRSTGTRRETEPPRYVRNLGDVEWLNRPEASWLDVGVDYRMRYEYRDDDIRRPVAALDEPILTRSRVYLGVREKFDPLRGYIEFEDARRDNSQFPRDNRDVNEAEIIQAVGELYFEDGFSDRPFRLQAGRMAFEYVDRRLIGRNLWRNTTNNFQGFRAILGGGEERLAT